MNLSLRSYGVILFQNKVLLCKEWIAGMEIIKLPGGGMEPLEGPRECIIREIKEELDITINPEPHPFYVTPNFLKSKFLPNTQIVLSYYLCKLDEKPNSNPSEDLEEIFWEDINQCEKQLSLESDKYAIAQLLENGKLV
ncbi:NUDIX domain-containing protein [Luteibaculum oceani]|uniref:NUDIX hydrolase n=1 Tax=Luteibaculum oceani TaxID=1294296 RepID=A0A5C6V8P3_9FLAO|nr:NUDIX hydrolase [Luteibaculum oceani]TXC81439.1 NUDIX hydrolase [Luteibaculum oceani]